MSYNNGTLNVFFQATEEYPANITFRDCYADGYEETSGGHRVVEVSITRDEDNTSSYIVLTRAQVTRLMLELLGWHTLTENAPAYTFNAHPATPKPCKCNCEC